MFSCKVTLKKVFKNVLSYASRAGARQPWLPVPSFSLSNIKYTKGENGEVLLKKYFFLKSLSSSIPEYTKWFASSCCHLISNKNSPVRKISLRWSLNLKSYLEKKWNDQNDLKIIWRNNKNRNILSDRISSWNSI